MTVDVAIDLNARVDALLSEAKAIDARLAEIRAALQDCSAAARLYGVDLRGKAYREKLRSALTVRRIVMKQLADAGSAGLKVSDLRPHCGDVHDKTIGMTLYRLRMKKLCRREGRRWYVAEAPEKDQTLEESK